MKSSILIIRRFLFALLSVCVVFVMFFSLEAPTFSAIPKLENIRVALLIDNVRFTTPPSIVTLEGIGGLNVGVGADAATQAWLSYPQNTQVRASIHQFRLQMLDTENFLDAKLLYNKLLSISRDTYISKQVVGEVTRFIVNYGSYATLAEATNARNSIMQNIQISSLVNFQSVKLAGTLFWQLAQYSSLEAAQSQADLLNEIGIATSIALQETSEGTLSYRIWIGNETTQQELETLKQNVSTLLNYKKIYVVDDTVVDAQELNLIEDENGHHVYILDADAQEPIGNRISDVSVLTESNEISQLLNPNDITFTQANVESPYILIQSDVSQSTDGLIAQPHLVLGKQAQKTIFFAKETGIKVKEKSFRTYRGWMEISSFQDHLALINELPMDQYLFAVVGSELSSSFPIEALKAQAVAARTYAITQGNKYQIANVSDTTYDQAYYGMGVEFENSRLAASQTSSEVIVGSSGNLITPFYSSNAGGLTADGSEVWGNTSSYLQSVTSPDTFPALGKTAWTHVKLFDGREAYVRSDFLVDTGTVDGNGVAIYSSNTNGVNVRLAPYVENILNPGIYKLGLNEQVLKLDETVESNNYNWIRGPYDEKYVIKRLETIGMTFEKWIQVKLSDGRVGYVRADFLDDTGNVNADGVKIFKSNTSGVNVRPAPFVVDNTNPSMYQLSNNEQVLKLSETVESITSLEVTKTGPSGRVLEMKVNGNVIRVSYPDAYRTLWGGLPSTKFEVRQVLAYLNTPPSGFTLAQKQFLFVGYGFGHGLGMSQWGAKALAEQGEDYQSILKHYYQNVDIVRNE